MLWEKLGQFETLFNTQHHNDFGSFMSHFVTQREDGSFEPTGLFWEVDDVGILYLTDIRPGYEAVAHFTFWDRRYKGREELLREMLRYTFELLQLRRIVVEVPLWAIALMGYAERLGFVKEGRKRETNFHKGQWFDSNLYSLLHHEV